MADYQNYKTREIVSRLQTRIETASNLQKSQVFQSKAYIDDGENVYYPYIVYDINPETGNIADGAQTEIWTWEIDLFDRSESMYLLWSKEQVIKNVLDRSHEIYQKNLIVIQWQRTNPIDTQEVGLRRLNMVFTIRITRGRA